MALGIGSFALAYFSWQLPSPEARLLRNTLVLGATSLVIALPMAAALAYALTRCQVPGRAFWEACLLVLLFVPLYIQLAAWEAGFGTGGWYSLLVAGTLRNPPLDGFRGAVWVHAVAAVPWLYWILRLGLTAIPRTYEDAASLDGTRVQVFRHILIPLSLPAFLACVFYVFIITSTEITATDRYQFRSYAEVLYNEFVLNSRFDELPLSVAPMAVTMVCVLGLGLALCRLLWPAFVHATQASPPTPHRPHWLAFGIVAAIVPLLLAVPIGNLLYQAGIKVEQVGQERTRVWSLFKALQICGRSPVVYAQELAWTAVSAQVSTLAALSLAVGVAAWAHSHRWREAMGATLAVLCFVTPGPFIGLGLIWIFNRNSPALLGILYDETIFVPCLALTMRCFPFCYLFVMVAFKTVPAAIYETSKIDGASAWQRLWHVTIPIIRPNLLCAATVSLAVCVGELSASILVLPPGVTTVAARVFNLIHYGAEDELAGICLACLGLMTGLCWMTWYTFHRRRPSF